MVAVRPCAPALLFAQDGLSRVFRDVPPSVPGHARPASVLKRSQVSHMSCLFIFVCIVRMFVLVSWRLTPFLVCSCDLVDFTDMRMHTLMRVHISGGLSVCLMTLLSTVVRSHSSLRPCSSNAFLSALYTTSLTLDRYPPYPVSVLTPLFPFPSVSLMSLLLPCHL